MAAQPVIGRLGLKRLKRIECYHVRLTAPAPEVLRVMGEESRRKGTDKLTSRRIAQIIKAVRAQKSKRG
jgi:protoporphyrinogen oxidase